MLRRSAQRVVLLAALVVVGYLLFNTIVTTLKGYRLASDEQQARNEIAKLDAQYRDLLAIREYLSSDEYIESVARRVLGLVKPGDTLVRVTAPEGETGEQDAAEKEDRAGETWWESLFEP